MQPQKTKSENMTKLFFVRKQQKHNSLFMQCDKNAFAVGMKAQNETQQIERNAQIKTEKSPVKPPKTPSSTKKHSAGNGQKPAKSGLTKRGIFD